MSDKKTNRSVLGPRGRRKLGLSKGENYKDPGGHQSGNLGSQSVPSMEVKKQSSPGEARAEVKKPQQTGKGGKGGLRLSSEAEKPSCEHQKTDPSCKCPDACLPCGYNILLTWDKGQSQQKRRNRPRLGKKTSGTHNWRILYGY